MKHTSNSSPTLKGLFMVILMFSFRTAIAQEVVFNDYFNNQTLRIDYIHTGNAHSEEFTLNRYHAGGQWVGTRAFLIEPRRYGDVLFQVFDYETDKVIFSRSYNTLFHEYCASEKGETIVESFEESINMPMPKAKVKYQFLTYNRRNESKVVYEDIFDPEHDATLPFVKEHKTTVLHKGGKPEDCLDILFIPEGYAQSDAKKMKADMKRFKDYFLQCSPYKEHKKNINIYTLDAFSPESGVTDPNKKIFKNTLLHCSYNVTDVDRYLMCPDVWNLNAIADDAPYDQILIIVNSSKYGGGGIYNFYCTVYSDGEYTDYVSVHEFGHSLGGLADEYYTSEVGVQDYYPLDIEPKEPNLTTLVDFKSKWQSMMNLKTPIPTPTTAEYENTLGVFEGGGYVEKGVYRPVQECSMKSKSYNQFCPVCTQAIIEAIEYYR
ncbi:MAG: IgA Peptidase M64 [Bacteroidales bacterium]|jgi:hypothetical protein|nr:IgA Peptidase M64 [Bacteroidales bacterium]